MTCARDIAAEYSCIAIGRRLGAGLAALALSASALGAAYHEETLANGLRVVLIEHHANPMVASSVVVGAGVVNEPEGMNGASHFLEHLLFNGTETRTQRELYDVVDRYGAYNNATTREDHTLFSLLIQKEFMGQGLEIQADMLFHSTIPPENFEKEKGIVLEELARDRADPSYLAALAHRGFAYAGTPLARSVLGTEESIAGMKRDDVLAYYRSRYVPSNMTLVLMGDFEVASALETVKRTFGATPASTSAKPPEAGGSWPARPAPPILRVPIDAERAYLSFTMPLGLAVHDRRLAAIELLLAAVASGQDAPLNETLTSGAQPLVYAFSLGVAPRAAGWSSIEFEAVMPADTSATAVLDPLQAQIRGLRPRTPAWDRVAGVRATARTDEVLLADRIHYYAMTLSSYVAGAPDGYLRDRVRTIESLSDAELEQAAGLLREALGRARATWVRPGVEEGRLEWPAGGSAVEAVREPERRLTRVLPSGLQVAVERSDDSAVFAMHVLFRPRAASEPAGKKGIADFLHRLYPKGTLVRDAAALDAAMAALGASIKVHDEAGIPYDDYYTTSEFSWLRLEMPADRWREGVALVAEMVVHPRLAPDDVEAVRGEILDLLSREAVSPSATARGLLAAQLAPGHPQSSAVLGDPASIGSITVEDLRAFHGAYVTGKRTIVTASGPVDPETVARAVAEAFGDLGPGADLPVVAPPPITPPGLRAEATLGKEQAYLALGYLFDAEPKDREALDVAGAMLSDRLSFTLREERGLAYSMGASFGPWAGRTRFAALMGTRPENVDAALQGLLEGLREFREGEIDDAAVERAANALRGRTIMRRMTRVNLAYFAGIERMENRAEGDDAKSLEALLEVTAGDVRRVVKRYLKPESCAIVTVR